MQRLVTKMFCCKNHFGSDIAEMEITFTDGQHPSGREVVIVYTCPQCKNEVSLQYAVEMQP